MEHLGTERMTFRRVTPDDIDALVELDADPRVMRYLTGRPTPRARYEDQLMPRYFDEYARGIPGRWLAYDGASGAFLGWFGLDSDTSPPDQREIGYRLRSSAWGRGLATEGSCELLRYAFAELGLDRVWGQTMAVNAGSRRVMEKIGMRHVRTFHLEFDDPVPGTEHGEVEYGITRKRWLHRG